MPRKPDAPYVQFPSHAVVSLGFGARVSKSDRFDFQQWRLSVKLPKLKGLDVYALHESDFSVSREEYIPSLTGTATVSRPNVPGTPLVGPHPLKLGK